MKEIEAQPTEREPPGRPPLRVVALPALASGAGAAVAAAVYGGLDATTPLHRVVALVVLALVLGGAAGALLAALWQSHGPR